MPDVSVICFKCNAEKPVSEFHKNPTAKCGHDRLCKKCRHASNNLTHKIYKRSEKYREKYAQGILRWKRNNPMKNRYTVQRRREVLLKCAGHHTLKDWIAKVEFHGWRCFYCGDQLTVHTLNQDHRIPLSKNGTAWVANLAPTCKYCNSRKKARIIA